MSLRRRRRARVLTECDLWFALKRRGTMVSAGLIVPSLARERGILAGFTTRRAGITIPPHSISASSAGAGLFQERLQRHLRELGLPADRIALAEQVHGPDVALVDGPGFYRGVDALVTGQNQLMLTIRVADCAAILLADPVAKVIGACHSGWRGTVGRIVERTVEAMTGAGALPGRVRAYVSPCISAANFEVGEEVAEQFATRYVHRHAGRPRPFVDLKTAIRDQLTASGLLTDAIETSDACTFEDTSTYFSFRAEGEDAGRMIGYIMLD